MSRIGPLAVLGSFLLGGSPAYAQMPRVEAGVEFGGLRETALGEYPVIAGGRVSARLFRLVGFEVEANRFPVGGAFDVFPATQALFGARIGERIGPLGLYGKIRPGLIRFDRTLYVPNLDTRAALDIGAILELYSRRHVAGRFDLGDTVVWYGSGTVIPPIAGIGGPVVAGTRHQLQWSLGISVWF